MCSGWRDVGPSRGFWNGQTLGVAHEKLLDKTAMTGVSSESLHSVITYGADSGRWLKEDGRSDVL